MKKKIIIISLIAVLVICLLLLFIVPKGASAAELQSDGEGTSYELDFDKEVFSYTNSSSEEVTLHYEYNVIGLQAGQTVIVNAKWALGFDGDTIFGNLLKGGYLMNYEIQGTALRSGYQTSRCQCLFTVSDGKLEMDVTLAPRRTGADPASTIFKIELTSISAVYENAIRVTFDLDGKGLDRYAYVTSGSTAESVAPSVGLQGYKFVGWLPSITETIITEETTFVAQWEELYWTVTFDTAGGSYIEPVQVRDNTFATAPENPTRYGYEFVGWQPAVESTLITQDTTFTALWSEKDKFTVSFYDNFGRLISTQEVYEGESAVPPTPPDIDGYRFDGWNTDAYMNVTIDLQVQAIYTQIFTFNHTHYGSAIPGLSITLNGSTDLSELEAGDIINLSYTQGENYRVYFYVIGGTMGDDLSITVTGQLYLYSYILYKNEATSLPVWFTLVIRDYSGSSILKNYSTANNINLYWLGGNDYKVDLNYRNFLISSGFYQEMNYSYLVISDTLDVTYPSGTKETYDLSRQLFTYEFTFTSTEPLEFTSALNNLHIMVNSRAGVYAEVFGDGQDKGFNVGYDKGVNDGLSNDSILATIGDFFEIFNIKIVGDITLGTFILIPIIVGVVFFILKLVRG